MRCYVGVTPGELKDFLEDGSLEIARGSTLTHALVEANPEADEEELEFELSLIAAEESKSRQDLDEARGFVLALEVPSAQVGAPEDDGVVFLAPLKWSFVEAVLISDSDDSELSWFAPQEVSSEIDSWLS